MSDKLNFILANRNQNHIRLLFGIYLISLVVIAVMPINGANNTTLTNVFVVRIRLDHLLHATLFTPWAFLYLITFHPVKWKGKLILLLSGLLMASITEGVQYFLSHRSYNINDLLSNWIGIVLGIVFLFISTPFLSERVR